MPISAAERRFIRNWEEQRTGGRTSYVFLYTFAYTMVSFITSIAIGLFLSIPFIKAIWLVLIGFISIILGFIIASVSWQQKQSKFQKIIKREMGE